MTVSNLVNRMDYVGTGLVSTYDFDFPIFVASDLLVTEVDDEGDETTLVLNTGYTVSIDTDGTGSITLTSALTDDHGLTIRRVLPLTQATDIRNQGDYYAEAHEKQFDRLVMIAQQQQNDLDRCIKAAETDDLDDALVLPPVAERAGKFLAFDTDGNVIASSGGIDGSVTTSAFGETLVDDADASAALTTLGVSTYAKTLLDDTTAANARTTLGATAGEWGSSTLANGAATGAKRTLTIASEKTSAHTVLTSEDLLRGNPDSAAFDFTLHSAASVSGKKVTFIHSGSAYSNVLGVVRAGSDTIGKDGLTRWNMTVPGERLTLVANGTNWIVDDHYIPRSLENFILNGSMDAWQAGTSFTTISASRYAADQWAYLKTASAAVVSLLQSNDVPTFTQSGFQSSWSLHVDCTTVDASIAAGDLVAVEQPIIGEDFAHLFGKCVTLSFWVKATKTGTYCVSFRNNGVDRSYVAEYTVNTTATWERKTITVVLNPTGGTNNFTRSATGLWVGFTLAGGSTFQTTANAWQTGNFHCTSNQVNAMDSTSNDFRLTQVQLVIGNETHAFRRYGKTAEDERLALETFYQKSYNFTVNPGAVTSVGGVAMRVSSSLRLSAQFRTRMINTPTVIAYSTSDGAVDNVFNIDGTANAAATYANTGENGFTAIATVSDGQSAQFLWTANAQITPA